MKVILILSLLVIASQTLARNTLPSPDELNAISNEAYERAMDQKARDAAAECLEIISVNLKQKAKWEYFKAIHSRETTIRISSCVRSGRLDSSIHDKMQDLVVVALLEKGFQVEYNRETTHVKISW
jgi:hypothetical protein